MSPEHKLSWFNPFVNHPALRALYIFSWLLSVIAAMTIVNSTHRYDSMPPVDFVIALIIPIILTLYRIRMSIQDDIEESPSTTVRPACSLTIAHTFVGIPLFTKVICFDDVVINTTEKHPRLEFWRKGKVAYQVRTLGRVRLSDLVIALAPEKLEELFDQDNSKITQN